MIHDQLKNEMKEAMKARDAVRLQTIRSLLSAFTNELVATKRMPTDVLPDEDALKVIKRSANQHKDSIEQFTKGGRMDLVEGEMAELKIIESYLPAQMNEEGVLKIVIAKKEELGVTDKTGMGKLMQAVMTELKGQADGAMVKRLVDAQF